MALVLGNLSDSWSQPSKISHWRFHPDVLYWSLRPFAPLLNIWFLFTQCEIKMKSRRITEQRPRYIKETCQVGQNLVPRHDRNFSQSFWVLPEFVLDSSGSRFSHTGVLSDDSALWLLSTLDGYLLHSVYFACNELEVENTTHLWIIIECFNQRRYSVKPGCNRTMLS